MRRSALRNLTVGLAATVALGATANFASADDDLGLAAGDHTISIPGVGNVMLTVDANGNLGVFTAPDGFALVVDSLEGGDELEFVLTASTDPARSVKVEFKIDADGELSVEGEVKDLDADDIDDSDDSDDSEPSLDDSDDSDDSEPSVDDSDESDDSEESDDTEPSLDESADSEPSEPSEPSVDSEPSDDEA